MRKSIIAIWVCGFTLVGGMTVDAVSEPGNAARLARESSLSNVRHRVLVQSIPPSRWLQISNVQLESARDDAPKPSAVLTFDLLNDTESPITDIVIEVVILEKPGSERPLDKPRVLVGPFMIRGSDTIEPGYTVNYQVLLRNLSSDCSCVADVSIVAARPSSRTSLTP